MCCAIIVECVAHCQVRKRHAPALNFSKKKAESWFGGSVGARRRRRRRRRPRLYQVTMLRRGAVRTSSGQLATALEGQTVKTQVQCSQTWWWSWNRRPRPLRPPPTRAGSTGSSSWAGSRPSSSFAPMSCSGLWASHSRSIFPR